MCIKSNVVFSFLGDGELTSLYFTSVVDLKGHKVMYIERLFENHEETGSVLCLIGDAGNMAHGFWPKSWPVLAIVACVVGVPAWATQAVSMHLLGTEAGSKKKGQLGLFYQRWKGEIKEIIC